MKFWSLFAIVNLAIIILSDEMFNREFAGSFTLRLESFVI